LVPQSRYRQMLVVLLAAMAVLAAAIAATAAAIVVTGGWHRIWLTGGTGTGGVAQQLGRLARRLPVQRTGQDAHESQSPRGTGRMSGRQVRYLGQNSSLSSVQLKKQNGNQVALKT